MPGRQAVPSGPDTARPAAWRRCNACSAPAIDNPVRFAAPGGGNKGDSAASRIAHFMLSDAGVAAQHHRGERDQAAAVGQYRQTGNPVVLGVHVRQDSRRGSTSGVRFSASAAMETAPDTAQRSGKRASSRPLNGSEQARSRRRTGVREHDLFDLGRLESSLGQRCEIPPLAAGRGVAGRRAKPRVRPGETARSPAEKKARKKVFAMRRAVTGLPQIELRKSGVRRSCSQRRTLR